MREKSSLAYNVGLLPQEGIMEARQKGLIMKEQG